LAELELQFNLQSTFGRGQNYRRRNDALVCDSAAVLNSSVMMPSSERRDRIIRGDAGANFELYSELNVYSDNVSLSLFYADDCTGMKLML
jgi:hypothetical protein